MVYYLVLLEKKSKLRNYLLFALCFKLGNSEIETVIHLNQLLKIHSKERCRKYIKERRDNNQGANKLLKGEVLILPYSEGVRTLPPSPPNHQKNKTLR